MLQQVNATINGQQYTLEVEPEFYNGHKVYYILNDDIEHMFHHLVPDHLVLMETDTGFACSPKLEEMESGYIVQQIWRAIKATC
ncbi:hypothetical protein [Chitinophaga sp. 212800010-3]|uniref:hypothetical protein n=1 Tax=unclassified Chitinophaga TaxID=2619133 RepID=UPI002DEE9A12|nr:Cytoplasmic protein [Chitinophaga sp. 212800010-3]